MTFVCISLDRFFSYSLILSSKAHLHFYRQPVISLQITLHSVCIMQPNVSYIMQYYAYIMQPKYMKIGEEDWYTAIWTCYVKITRKVFECIESHRIKRYTD